MEMKTAIPLSIGVIAITFTAFALAKKRPYISSAIFGSLGAFGLVYGLLASNEISEIRSQLGEI